MLALADDGTEAQRVLDGEAGGGDEAMASVRLLNMWVLRMTNEDLSQGLAQYLQALTTGDTLMGLSLANDTPTVVACPRLATLKKVLEAVSDRLDLAGCEKAARSDGDAMARVLSVLYRLMNVSFFVSHHYAASVMKAAS
jgi:hypothetical protein